MLWLTKTTPGIHAKKQKRKHARLEMECTHPHHLIAIDFDDVGQAGLLDQGRWSAHDRNSVDSMVQGLVALKGAVFPNHLFVNVSLASLPALRWVAECEAICME